VARELLLDLVRLLVLQRGRPLPVANGAREVALALGQVPEVLFDGRIVRLAPVRLRG
jgi:hypothetical protein